MKKLFICLMALFSIAFLFDSCTKDENFDEALLVGKWQLVGGTEIYKYNADHTGGFWDPADQVYENEAQPFTWTLDKSDLTQIHIMAIGGSVAKSYTVTELTSTSLKYRDDLGNKSYSFSKIAR